MRKTYALFNTRFRQKRIAEFEQRFSRCESVLDLGGWFGWWKMSPWRPKELTLVNLEPAPEELPIQCRFVQGNACALDFSDQSFDLAMSNSVIEHVSDQAAFAREMLRVGRSIYCQTPAKWFPVEPHLLGLFVHWLPHRWFPYWLHRYFTLEGWINKPDRAEHEAFKQEVHLLTKSDLEKLFPGCQIGAERFLGLTKSYIVTRNAPAKGSGVRDIEVTT
jgi:SAM-dependent methyltransferase